MDNKSLPEELCADLVLLNGKIITVDNQNSIAEAVACKNEKIIKNYCYGDCGVHLHF